MTAVARGIWPIEGTAGDNPSNYRLAEGRGATLYALRLFACYLTFFRRT
jgi:hypothetical protein